MTSRQWVEKNIKNKGRSWVQDNYKQHRSEVDDPCSTESFSRYVREFSNKIIVEDYPKVDYEQIGEDAVTYVVNSSNIKTLEQLIDYCRVDTVKWKVKKFRVNKWGNDKNPNFQVRAELERNTVEPIDNFLKNFIKDAKKHSPKYPKFSRKKNNKEQYMLEISLPDIHHGQLSWKDETGDAHYDLKISQETFLSTVDYMLKASNNFQFEKILFIIGNDFFNVNNATNTTFNGTPQHEDGRWQKSFTTGLRMAVKAIDMMLKYADVDILVIPGNHDYERAFYLGATLEAWYRLSDQVNVNNGPKPTKYYQYGNNLIGFDHGTKSGGQRKKLEDLPLIMADEADDLWSKAKYREIHTGHVHKFETVEVRGIRIVALPSMVPSSQWASAQGYRHLRESLGIVWKKSGGRKQTIHYQAEEVDD